MSKSKTELVGVDRFDVEMHYHVSPLTDEFGEYVDIFKSLSLTNNSGGQVTFNFDSNKQIIKVISKLVDLFLEEGK